MIYQSPRYLSCAESAKLLRAALKAEFPGVKFSVRSRTYAGGASIDVEWLDGPTGAQVDAVCSSFRSADFDGMIDMESSRYHWITPQGEIYVAEVAGTEGSRGTVPAERYIKPHDEAELVHLGSKYISTRRNFSLAMLERAARWALDTWGEAPELKEHASTWKGETTRWTTLEAPSWPEMRMGAWNAAELAYREMWSQAGPRHADRIK